MADPSKRRDEWCPERAAKPRVEGLSRILLRFERRCHRRRVPWVYILRCGDNTFYVGRTNDIEARLRRHRAGHGANHTALRLPVDLAYTEEFRSTDQAVARERQLKRWSAMKKAALIDGDLATLKRLAKRRRPKRSS